MKRQVMDWEKTSANHISDERLVSRIYKELAKSKNHKKKTQFKNTQKT